MLLRYISGACEGAREVILIFDTTPASAGLGVRAWGRVYMWFVLPATADGSTVLLKTDGILFG